MKIAVTKLRDGRRSPWLVRHFVNGQFKRRFFKTRSEAECFACDLRTKFERGTAPAAIEAALRLSAGTGFNLAELVRAGLGVLQPPPGNRHRAKLVSEGAEIVLARARKIGLRRETIRSYQSAFAILVKAFGNRIAECITQAEVEKFLSRIPSASHAQGASVDTKKTYLRSLRMVMRAAGVKDPVPEIAFPRRTEEEPKCFTVEDVRALFAAARNHERGTIALAVFAGLRPSRLQEVPVACINVAERRIHIPRAIAKNGQGIELRTPERDWPGLPPVLWEWLAKYPFRQIAWHKLQTRLSVALGARWIHDGCRHTAATYYHALHGIHATKALLTHISPGVAVKHYVGYATVEDAEKFYAITPDTVPETRNDRAHGKKVNYSKEELEALLQNKRIAEIASELSCTTGAVFAAYKKMGIKMRVREQWADNFRNELAAEQKSDGNA